MKFQIYFCIFYYLKMNSDSKIIPIMKNKIDQLDTKTNVLYVENIKNKDERKIVLKELENLKLLINDLDKESINNLMEQIKTIQDLNFPKNTDMKLIYEIISGVNPNDDATAANQAISDYIRGHTDSILQSIDKLIANLNGFSNDVLNDMKNSTVNNTNVLRGISNDDLTNLKNSVPTGTDMNKINQTITGATTIDEGNTEMTSFTSSGKNLIDSVVRLNNLTSDLSDSYKVSDTSDVYKVITGKNTVEEAKNELIDYAADETKNLITKTTPLSYDSDGKILTIDNTSSVNINNVNPISFNNNGMKITNNANYLNLNGNQLTLKLEKMNTEQIFNNVKTVIETSDGTADITNRRTSLITAEAVTEKFQELDMTPFKLISEENSLKIYNSKLNSSYDFDFNYDSTGKVTVTEGPTLNNLNTTSPLGVINSASSNLLVVNDFVIYQDRFASDTDSTPISQIKRGVINYTDPETHKRVSIPNRFKGKIENDIIYIGHDTTFKSFNDITSSGTFNFNEYNIKVPDTVENFIMQNLVTDDSDEFDNKKQYVSLNFYYSLGKLVYNKNNPNELKYYISEYTNYIHNDGSILSYFKNFSFPCDIDFANTEFAECIGLIFKNDYRIVSNSSVNYVIPRNYIRKILNIKLNQNTTNFVGFIRNLDVEEVTFVKNNTTAENNELTFSKVSVSAGFLGNARNLKIQDYIKKYGINKWKMADGFDSHNLFSYTGAYNFYGYSIYKGASPIYLKDITILDKNPDESDIIDFSYWNKSESGEPINANCYSTFESFMYNGRIKVPKIKISSDNGYSMFYYSLISEVVNLNDIDVSNATNLSYMFYNCINMDKIDIGKWDLSNVTTYSGFMDQCINLTSLTINAKFVVIRTLSGPVDLTEFYNDDSRTSYTPPVGTYLILKFSGKALFPSTCNVYRKDSTTGTAKYVLLRQNDLYEITLITKAEGFENNDDSRILTLTLTSHVETQ